MQLYSLAFTFFAALLLNATVSGYDGEFDKESLHSRYCPLSRLQSAIHSLDCSGTLLQCARSAREIAQRQFADEGDHQGYAWGALVIRANSSITDYMAWSMNAVKPSGWFCTALTKSRTNIVHVFRTGYRYRNSTQDQWTYLANRHPRAEACPLLALKAYMNQHGQPSDASSFVNELLHFTKTEYQAGQFYHELWNVIVVSPQGREMLKRDFDFSFPVYLYDGHAACCMMSTANGWLAVVTKVGYADANEEAFSRSRRYINQIL